MGSETLVLRKGKAAGMQLAAAGSCGRVAWRGAPVVLQGPALHALTAGQDALIPVEALVAPTDTIWVRSQGE